MGAACSTEKEFTAAKVCQFQSISRTIPAIINSPGSGEDDFIIIRVMKSDENKVRF